MTVSMEKQALSERLQHLFTVISGQRFLQKQGLGNEVPFFICPYKPEEAVEMERARQQLIKRLGHSGVRALDINLYDLSIEILKSRGIWERVLDIETCVPKDELQELLQGVLDPADKLMPAIADKLANANFDVLFMSGVGEVFPYIRSHKVLNNLQSTAKEKPTVMFFPGAYTHSLESGASLDLFGSLRDDRYYRAFNIFHYEA